METRWTEHGLWIQKGKTDCIVGLSEKGYDETGDIAFVALPLEKATLEKNETLLSVEGEKAVTEFSLPFHLTDITWHEELEEEPERLNNPVESERWIARFASLSEEEWGKLKENENTD